ncbi:MAG: hypothetical protein F6K00_24540 [Leptolyngbya sp. SIOISBB]|nr:hypothetical protein [Leptolyngbya sp. SIOISBB]
MMKINLKYEATPENAKLFAADIVAATQDISGILLDYSPQGVQAVDDIIENLRSGDSSMEDLATTLFEFGCYLGEVFVRNHGAIWKVSSETSFQGMTSMPLLIEMPNGGIGNPIGKVFKQFDNGEEDSISYFYDVFRSREDPQGQ